MATRDGVSAGSSLSAPRNLCRQLDNNSTTEVRG